MIQQSLDSKENFVLTKKQLLKELNIKSPTTLSNLLNVRLFKYLEPTGYQKNDKFLYRKQVLVLVEHLGYTRELF